MSLIITNATESKTLDLILGRANYEALSLHLYTNNRVPTVFDSTSQYTELEYQGYAPIDIDPLLWATSIVNGNIALATYPQQLWTFTASSSVVVYGGFIVNTVTGALWGAEVFLTPFTIKHTGDTIKWNIAFNLAKGTAV